MRSWDERGGGMESSSILRLRLLRTLLLSARIEQRLLLACRFPGLFCRHGGGLGSVGFGLPLHLVNLFVETGAVHNLDEWGACRGIADHENCRRVVEADSGPQHQVLLHRLLKLAARLN